MSKKVHFWGLVFLLLVLLLPQCATADMFEKGLKLRGGGFWAYMDTKLNAHIPGTIVGRVIDYESDLALDDTKFSPFFGVTYRLNKKHAIQLNYFSLHRNSEKKVVTKPFEFTHEDTTYRVAAGARLETLLDLDIYHMTYMYSFYSSDSLMVAGTLGAHVVKVENGYQGELGIVVNDHVVSYSGEGFSESVTAPLPDIGFLAYYKVSGDIVLGARAQYFALEIDNVDGELIDLHCEVLKYLDTDQHWAIGAAFQYYRVKVDYSHKKKRYALDLDIKYQGPIAFIQYEF